MGIYVLGTEWKRVSLHGAFVGYVDSSHYFDLFANKVSFYKTYMNLIHDSSVYSFKNLIVSWKLYLAEI